MEGERYGRLLVGAGGDLHATRQAYLEPAWRGRGKDAWMRVGALRVPLDQRSSLVSSTLFRSLHIYDWAPRPHPFLGLHLDGRLSLGPSLTGYMPFSIHMQFQSGPGPDSLHCQATLRIRRHSSGRQGYLRPPSRHSRPSTYSCSQCSLASDPTLLRVEEEGLLAWLLGLVVGCEG